MFAVYLFLSMAGVFVIWRIWENYVWLRDLETYYEGRYSANQSREHHKQVEQSATLIPDFEVKPPLRQHERLYSNLNDRSRSRSTDDAHIQGRMVSFRTNERTAYKIRQVVGQ